MSDRERTTPDSVSKTDVVSKASTEVDDRLLFSETMRLHQEAIKKIIDHGIELGQETDPIRALDEGEIDDVKYQVVFRSGKQQPVRIIHFTFSNGADGEAVFRQAFDIPKIEGFYEKTAVKNVYPELYLSHKGVLVMECIQGFEEKRSGEAFAKHIESSVQFQQLINESFTMIDAILEGGLTLRDIAPAKGHNIIFDINAEKYRFFDVGTLYPREHSSAMEDFFYLADQVRLQTEKDRKNRIFWLLLIKKYREKYPNATVNHVGETFKMASIKRLANREEAGEYPQENIVYPDNPLYDQLYKSFNWRGSLTQGEDKSKWLPLLKTHSLKRTVTYIDEEFLKACDTADFELADKILEEKNQQIILQKDVLVDEELPALQ